MYDPQASKGLHLDPLNANLRLQIIAQASQIFADAGISYSSALETVTKTTAEMIQGSCIIWLASENAQWLDSVAFHDVDPSASEAIQHLFGGNRISVDAVSQTTTVFRNQQPILIPVIDFNAVRKSRNPTTLPIIESAAQFSFFSFVAAPMRVRGHIFGVLCLGRHGANQAPFNALDVDLAQHLADRAASAIENARLFEQLQSELEQRKQSEAIAKLAADRLKLVAEAAQIFAEASTDDQASLEQVVHKVSEFFNGICTLRLLSDDKQWLSAVIFDDVNPETTKLIEPILDHSPWNVNAQKSFLEAFRKGQPYSWSINKSDQDFTKTDQPLVTLAKQVGLSSCIWVPLIVKGESIGLMTLARYGTNQSLFDENDLQLAKSVANRVAFVIQNSRLLDRLREERRTLAQRVEESIAELRLRNTELIRAIQLKDEFLANMSHELRTPLNSMLGQTQMLLEQIYGPIPPKQIESLKVIENSGQHLLNLINEVLDLSKIEAGSMILETGSIDVAKLCDACISMISARAARKKIKVTTTLDSAVEIIHGDERRIKQILINLLTNAVKFTSEGGRIGLEVNGDEAGKRVDFTVWDTGIGIAEKDLSKLFQPFIQLDAGLDRQYEGIGLGLALVKRLIEAHNGTVSVESTLEKGSRFRVQMPWQPS